MTPQTDLNAILAKWRHMALRDGSAGAALPVASLRAGVMLPPRSGPSRHRRVGTGSRDRRLSVPATQPQPVTGGFQSTTG